jgi:hypothetical protein
VFWPWKYVKVVRARIHDTYLVPRLLDLDFILAGEMVWLSKTESLIRGAVGEEFKILAFLVSLLIL